MNKHTSKSYIHPTCEIVLGENFVYVLVEMYTRFRRINHSQSATEYIKVAAGIEEETFKHPLTTRIVYGRKNKGETIQFEWNGLAVVNRLSWEFIIHQTFLGFYLQMRLIHAIRNFFYQVFVLPMKVPWLT